MYHLVFNFRCIMEELALKSEKKVDVANSNILTNSGQIMVVSCHLHYSLTCTGPKCPPTVTPGSHLSSHCKLMKIKDSKANNDSRR